MFYMTKTKECREKKGVCPFLLLENFRPLSPLPVPLSSSGTPDFLSTCLGIDSLISPFLLGELCCQGKGPKFSFHNYFLLWWGTVSKLFRQYFLLALILRVPDPGAPSNRWPRLARVCPGVSGGGMGQWWHPAGLGALTVAGPAWDLLKEVSLYSLPPP